MQQILKYFPELTQHQVDQFQQLDALYRDWNSKINVISRKDIDNLYEHHVLHSLGIVQVLRFKDGSSVMDLGCDERLFRRVVKTVFGQRRKMLRVSLRQLFSETQPQAGFYEQDIMTRRPEQLTIQEFIALTNLVAEQLR